MSVRVSGAFDSDDGYSLVVRSPPTVGSTPIEIELNVVDEDGSRVVFRRIETAGVERMDIALAVDEAS